MRFGSLRWWFENRETGQITVAQFPNWPLWGIAACWLAGLATDSATTAGEALSWIATGLWLFWAGDELVRGVNPSRRALGVGVILWQVLTLF